jgi:pyruvate dehydrogenase E1 component alpha subunit
VARARAGQGPTLIECKTYRHRRHTERPDQLDERPAEEVQAWLRQDPIERQVMRLREQQGQLNDEEWQAMERDVQRAVDAAVAFAQASPVPLPESALEDVFAP